MSRLWVGSQGNCNDTAGKRLCAAVAAQRWVAPPASMAPGTGVPRHLPARGRLQHRPGPAARRLARRIQQGYLSVWLNPTCVRALWIGQN
jgi:hypothetical protein